MDLAQVFAPIKALFRNRTFVTFLLSALVSVIVGLIPTIAPYQEQIVSVGVALVLLSAGGEVAQRLVDKTADTKVKTAELQLQTETVKAQALQAHAAPASSYMDVATIHKMIDEYMKSVLGSANAAAWMPHPQG